MSFRTAQARALIEYVSMQYGRDLEFLWPTSPGNAIWRRADNEKWFGVMMTVRRDKIIPGAGDDFIEILDVRCAPDVIDFIVDKKMIFPGWHMNKRHWITVVLNGRLQTHQIQHLLDASFELAYGK